MSKTEETMRSDLEDVLSSRAEKTSALMKILKKHSMYTSLTDPIAKKSFEQSLKREILKCMATDSDNNKDVVYSFKGKNDLANLVYTTSIEYDKEQAERLALTQLQKAKEETERQVQQEKEETERQRKHERVMDNISNSMRSMLSTMLDHNIQQLITDMQMLHREGALSLSVYSEFRDKVDAIRKEGLSPEANFSRLEDSITNLRNEVTDYVKKKPGRTQSIARSGSIYLS